MRALCAAAALGAVAPTFAQEAGALREVRIESTREDLQGVAASASEGVVTSRQLSTRPLLRAGEVMEAVPGLVATQHAGEGKANQYFLRGFNLDHGTDFATFVDGVPVNLPTHGHGQGYTDLNFLIPELVDSIHYRKGPYYAEEGDFATAGSARIRTVNKLPRPLGLVEAGRFGFRRVLAAGSAAVAGGDLLLAGEKSADDGPWAVPQRLSKNNLLAKYSAGPAAQAFSLALAHYEADWTSTDQTPQRAIDSGLLGRWSSLDPTAGGRTRRTALNASASFGQGEARTQLSAFALRYALDLFSNFTYYTRGCETAPLPPPCNAGAALDQFEQVDRRDVLGLALSQTRPFAAFGRDGIFSWGGDVRRDRIGEAGLYDTFQRQRLNAVRNDAATVDALGAWAQSELALHPQWTATAGARWDERRVDVSSSVAANSGTARAGLASPKLALVHRPTASTDLYLNWGRGFHSNDARGAVIRVDPRDAVTPVERATLLVRSQGWELGARQQWGGQLVTTVAAWALRLDSELVFVGDAGATEASRPSARKGLEFTANWRPAKAWEIDADLSLAHARFADADPAGDRIPGAMERVATLGATWSDGGWTAGVRVRHFGSHPLIEDNSLRGQASTTTNLRLARRIGASAELSMDVFNVFDRKLSDVQYAYASRLPGEPPLRAATPATVHLHPAPPRMLRLGWKQYF